MNGLNYRSMLFINECKIRQWGYQHDFTTGKIEVYQNEKIVQFNSYYMDIYELSYLSDKIQQTFDSIPNDPKMKKSKRWRKLTL